MCLILSLKWYNLKRMNWAWVSSLFIGISIIQSHSIHSHATFRIRITFNSISLPSGSKNIIIWVKYVNILKHTKKSSVFFAVLLKTWQKLFFSVSCFYEKTRNIIHFFSSSPSSHGNGWEEQRKNETMKVISISHFIFFCIFFL